MYVSARLAFLEADGDLTLSKAEKDRLFPAQRKWIKDKDKKVRRGNHEVV